MNIIEVDIMQKTELRESRTKILREPYSVSLARLILTSYSKIKDALFFKMFIYMYKKDFPKKKYFFFALTGCPEAIYFAL